MTTVEDNILKISAPSAHVCNIITTKCNLYEGDRITWGCYVKGAAGKRRVWLYFRNRWKTKENYAYLGEFSGEWCSGYYTVPKGKFPVTPPADGYLQLYAEVGGIGDRGANHPVRYSGVVKKATKLKCYDKTTDAGKKVTLEAKLEEAAFPYNDIKNGYVKFYVGGAHVGAAWTDADGKAYVDYTPAKAGTYTIKAAFAAAGDYNGSEGTCTLTVKAPPKKETKLKCYDKTIEVGKKVKLEAKLEERAFPYNDIKNGLIRFYVGGAYVGYGYTDADGKAYVDYTPAKAGTYTVKATFAAAGDYLGSEGTCTLTVKAPPKKETKIKCYDKTVEVNKKVTLEAKLEEKAFPYNDIKSGYVKFYMDGAYQGGAWTDADGKAYLDITPTAVKVFTIKAVFAAAGGYLGSEGTCTLTVKEIPKKDTKIKCYDKTTEVNKKVTLEAKLEEKAFPYNDIKNGYVKFYVGGAHVGAAWTDADGKAYVDYTPAKAGAYTIKATFAAAGDYNGSEGTCTLTVELIAKPKGAITSYTPPLELEEGKEVRVPTTIKNIGDAKGEFQMYLFDDVTAELIEKEPCPRPLPCYWKDLDPGKDFSDTLDSDWWYGAMPDHDWKLRIEVRNQKTPDVADHIVKFTVKLKEVVKETKIVNFSIRDEAEKDVTTLTVGKKYKLRAYLKEKPILGAPIPGVTIFFRKGDGTEIGHNTTNEEGYAGIFWVPESAVIGVYNIKAEFDGSEDYNRSSSSLIRITVEKELETHNFNVVYGVKWCGWGFDWLAKNVTKVFSTFIDFLHKYGLTDITAHAGKSYYDPGKKELVFNIDVPTHSSIPKAIFSTLLLFVPFVGPLLLLVLWLKGVFSTEPEKPARYAYIEPRNVVDGKPLPVAVTFTLSDETEVTAPAGGVATVELPEDSTLTIISAEGDSWALGKNAEDIAWKTKAIIPGATLVIDMHLADLSTRFSVPVQFEDGTPVEGAWVHIRHPEREEVRIATETDEEGLAWFENIERLKWVVAVAKAKEDLTYYDDGIMDLTVEPYVIPTLVISSNCVMSKHVTIAGTTIPIVGVTVDLVNVATDEVVETTETDADGYVSFLIPPDPDISYKFREVKEGYDEEVPTEGDEFPGDEPHHEHDEHDQTGDICQVSIVPTSAEVATIPGAIVKLYNETFTFGPEPVDPSGGIVIPEVPYGTYKIEVTAKDFEQSEEEKAKEYVVSAECKTNGLCLCEFQPLLTSTLVPGEALGKITYDPPFSAQEGDEIRIPTTIKNAGGKFGEFRMFLIDDVTNEEIEHEPKVTWEDLDPAELYTETLDTDYWVGAMPDHDWKLRIEVRNKITPDVADETKQFTVVLGGPAGHILVLNKIRTLVKGETYTFTGNLTKEGVPVAGEKIEIWEEDVFFHDKLCEGVTDDEGNFAIEWAVTAVEGILGGKNAEMYAKHPASETKTSVQKGILIKKPSKLVATAERHRINTLRPVTVELEYYDEVETKWKPVSGYPTEPEENPSEHVMFAYGLKHRVRAIREYVFSQLRSEWEEFDPLEWDKWNIKLDMKRYLTIGKEEEEEE